MVLCGKKDRSWHVVLRILMNKPEVKLREMILVRRRKKELSGCIC